jgi:hypothetical protein
MPATTHRKSRVPWDWQPYPNHPDIRALVLEKSRIEASFWAALEQMRIAGEFDSFREVLRPINEERRVIERKLAEVTQKVINDVNVRPWWRPCTEEDEDQGDISCVQCGNRVLSEEDVCSYCGWTFLIESPAQGERTA